MTNCCSDSEPPRLRRLVILGVAIMLFVVVVLLLDAYRGDKHEQPARTAQGATVPQ